MSNKGRDGGLRPIMHDLGTPAPKNSVSRWGRLIGAAAIGPRSQCGTSPKVPGLWGLVEEGNEMSLDVNEISATTLDVLKNRGHTLEQIEGMSPERAFNEYCEWHLPGWGPTLRKTIDELRAAKRA
jgi:hypothetical protein